MPTQKLLIVITFLVVVLGGGVLWWMQHPVTPASDPRIYVGLGASDTVGIGADRPTIDGWVPRVHASLPAGTQLLNLGISGATLGDVVLYELPPAIDAQPQWVSLWAGVNDLRAGVSLPAFVEQLDQALQPFSEQEPRPVVVVLNLPDLRHLPVFNGRAPAELDAAVQRWNAAIADAAQRHGALVVDLYAESFEVAAHPEYISADGFHPSSVGYARIAEVVEQTLEAHAATLAQ